MVTAIETSALYQSIHAQPDAVAEVLARTAGETARAAEMLVAKRRVWLVGTGTSLHAARVGAGLLRAAGLEAEASSAFDFALYPRPLSAEDAVVIISHRGSKQYSQQAIERALATSEAVLGVTGEPTLMSGPPLIIQTVPQERSATHTISYVTALAVLAATAAAVARERGADTSLSDAVAALPDGLRAMLGAEPRIREVAARTAPETRIGFAGGGPNEVTASEGALKVKEAAYMTAEGYNIEQFLHGPVIGMNTGDLLVLIGGEGPSADRLQRTARGATEIGMRVVSVGLDVDAAGAEVIAAPPVPEVLSPLLLVLPLQLLACFLAAERGTNPDSFRQEQEPYKRARTHYTL